MSRKPAEIEELTLNIGSVCNGYSSLAVQRRASISHCIGLLYLVHVLVHAQWTLFKGSAMQKRKRKIRSFDMAICSALIQRQARCTRYVEALME